MIFTIILSFIGVSIAPVIGNEISNITDFYKIQDKSLIDTDNNENFKVIEDCYSNTSWFQVIGDYPRGNLNNGFNNSFNVNVRGKTIFSVDDKDYLLFGTGNMNNPSTPFSMSISFPVLLILAAMGFAGIYPLFDIVSSGQSTLELVIKIIDIFFKQVSADGCELWYFNGSEWGQSVGNSINANIGSGFNNVKNTEITVLIPYKPQSTNDIEYLYAGTWNQKEGCEIWRTTDPVNGIWEPIIHKDGIDNFSSGFGNPNNTAAYSAEVFDNWLYIGTMNWYNGCEIWRTNGTVWQRIIGGGPSYSGLSYGFGDDDKGFERDTYAWEMKVFNDSYGDQLYVSTLNIAGCELWRTKNAKDWECLVGEDGLLERGLNKYELPVCTHNYGIRRMEIFNNSLFIGTASVPPVAFQYFVKYPFFPFLDWSKRLEVLLGCGCDIWRYNGSSLTRVVVGVGQRKSCSGFGDKTNVYIWSMEEYDGYLFASTHNPGSYVINITLEREFLKRPKITVTHKSDKNMITGSGGCEVWYTDDGENWNQIVGDEIHQINPDWPGNGFDDKYNIGGRALISYNDLLYIGTWNIYGCEVWYFNGKNYPEKTKDIV